VALIAVFGLANLVLAVVDFRLTADAESAHSGLASTTAKLASARASVASSTTQIATDKSNAKVIEQVTAYTAALDQARPLVATALPACVGSGSFCTGQIRQRFDELTAFRTHVAGLPIPPTLKSADDELRAGLDQAILGYSAELSGGDAVAGSQQVVKGIATIEEAHKLIWRVFWSSQT
jgi:hypothetical protein